MGVGASPAFSSELTAQKRTKTPKDGITTFDIGAGGRSRRLVKDESHVMLSLKYYEKYLKKFKFKLSTASAIYVASEGLTSLSP